MCRVFSLFFGCFLVYLILSLLEWQRLVREGPNKKKGGEVVYRERNLGPTCNPKEDLITAISGSRNWADPTKAEAEWGTLPTDWRSGD